MASNARGPASTRNGHNLRDNAPRESMSAPAAKSREGKVKGKKKGAKHAFPAQSSALDTAAPAPPPAPRGVARVFQQTVGDPPTPWPIYLLRQGLLLMVDGIDARYGTGTGTAIKGESMRSAGPTRDLREPDRASQA